MDLELPKLPELSDLSNLNLDLDLDTEWIQSYESDDKKYKHFYKEEVTSINIFCIYIDTNNTIIKIKRDKHYLVKNTINKEQLFYILQKNSHDNYTKFKLSTILKYNITLDPENILKFINSKHNSTQEYPLSQSPSEYLYPIKSIDDITYQDTINIFQELNSLFIIYNIKTETKNNNTSRSKRDYDLQNSTIPSYKNIFQSDTKRIYITQKHRKTKRK